MIAYAKPYDSKLAVVPLSRTGEARHSSMSSETDFEKQNGRGNSDVSPATLLILSVSAYGTVKSVQAVDFSIFTGRP